jgi:hypothetical protein
MGSVTDFTRKQMPHLSPVILAGGGLVLANLGTALTPVLREMQAKPKCDWFDFGILVLAIFGSIGTTIVAFINRSWGKYQDEREANKTGEAK